MIDEVIIDNWTGASVHLHLSSPQPELFEIKSLVPCNTRLSKTRAGVVPRTELVSTAWGGVKTKYTGYATV